MYVIQVMTFGLTRAPSAAKYYKKKMLKIIQMQREKSLQIIMLTIRKLA